MESRESITKGSLKPENYYSASLAELKMEIQQRTGESYDIEPVEFHGKLMIVGQAPLRSDAPLELVNSKIKAFLISRLLNADFNQAGISAGDKIEFESQRGNIRQLTFTGEITEEGIWVENINGGEKQIVPYLFRSIKSFRKI